MTQLTVDRASNHGAQSELQSSRLQLNTQTERKRPQSDTDDTQSQLCPQQRYVKRPKLPGMVTFDPSLRELPLQGSRVKGRHSPQTMSQQNPKGDNHEDQREEPESSTEVHNVGQHHDTSKMQAPSGAGEVRPTKSIALYRSLEDQNELQASAAKEVNFVAGVDTDRATSSFSPPDMFAADRMNTVKHIYAGLFDNSHITAEVANNPFYSNMTYNWRWLHGVRTKLLDDSHDFLSITKNPHSPDYLRRLALIYGSPERYTQDAISAFVPNLKAAPLEWKDQIVSFTNRAKKFLTGLDKSFGSSWQEWTSVNETIHYFMEVLAEHGLNYECVWDCDFTCQPWRSREWQGRKQSSVNALDQQLREEYFNLYPPPAHVNANEVDELYKATDRPLKEPVVCLLQGWLCFGPQIATSFHEFCKVFKYLAWVGATF